MTNLKKPATVLTPEFFARPTLVVAEELIGTTLVRSLNGDLVRATITEVEVYDGPQDKACHAHKGLTARTEVMFGPAGHLYVYLCYGMHWMLNIVTGDEGYPAAVLIRTVGEWDGPGKLTKALQIDGSLNGQMIHPDTGLWVASATEPVDRSRIKTTPRIGVDYAGEWAKKPYRFVADY